MLKKIKFMMLTGNNRGCGRLQRYVAGSVVKEEKGCAVERSPWVIGNEGDYSLM